MTQVVTALSADLAFEEFLEAERGRLFGAALIVQSGNEAAQSPRSRRSGSRTP